MSSVTDGDRTWIGDDEVGPSNIDDGENDKGFDAKLPEWPQPDTVV